MKNIIIVPGYLIGLLAFLTVLFYMPPVFLLTVLYNGFATIGKDYLELRI
jgi:hypothetical protein